MNQGILDFFNQINAGVEDDFDGKNYRFFHSMRTAKLAREIAVAEVAGDFDREALTILALFHDIGKNEKLMAENGLAYADHDPNNIVLFEKYIYPLLGEGKTLSALRELVPDFSYKAYTLDGSRAVRDGDNLDEIGILNLWRMGVYAGKHHVDVRESTAHYFEVDRKLKVEKMRGLFFEYSRRVCAERFVEMDALAERLRAVGVPRLEDL
jgi:hypothetical protein